MDGIWEFAPCPVFFAADKKQKSVSKNAVFSVDILWHSCYYISKDTYRGSKDVCGAYQRSGRDNPIRKGAQRKHGAACLRIRSTSGVLPAPLYSPTTAYSFPKTAPCRQRFLPTPPKPRRKAFPQRTPRHLNISPRQPFPCPPTVPLSKAERGSCCRLSGSV